MIEYSLPDEQLIAGGQPLSVFLIDLDRTGWDTAIRLSICNPLSVAAFAASATNPSASQIWITDVIIVSPEDLEDIEQGSVLIENGRIVRVERKIGVKKPAGATVVSEEQFLIPGLIDSYVHLASIPGVRFEVSFGPAEGKPHSHWPIPKLRSRFATRKQQGRCPALVLASPPPTFPPVRKASVTD